MCCLIRRKASREKMATFQNVSILSLYAVLLLYVNPVDMQSCQALYKSDSWLLFDCVKNTHWGRFKLEHIVYILHSSIMKYDTLFKHKVTMKSFKIILKTWRIESYINCNILPSSVIFFLYSFCVYFHLLVVEGDDKMLMVMM